MVERGTHGKPCAFLFVRGNDDLQVAIAKLHQLLSLKDGLIIISFVFDVPCACLGSGTGSNSAKCVDNDQESLLHTLSLVGIRSAIRFI